MAPALKVLVCSTLLAAAGVQAFAPTAIARASSTSRLASFNAAAAPRYSSSSRGVSSISMAAPDSEDAFRAIAGSPVWTLGATALALARPQTFSWVSADLVTKSVMGVMLLVGLNLKTKDLKAAAHQPKAVASGAALQYTAMPFMALLASKLFQLPPVFATGLCLTAAVPGGALSNIITHMAGADTGLSVTMTAVSTLLAVFATPLLTKLTIGGAVSVTFAEMLSTTLRLSLLPIVLGAAINSNAKGVSRKLAPYTHIASSLLIGIVTGSTVARNAYAITHYGARLLLAVTAMHTGGFILGYINARFTGLSELAARTISLETGIQNSAMAQGLARTTIGIENTATAAVSAISTVVHTTIGAALAAYWRKNPVTNADTKQ